jgi:hypothetical protein
VENVFGNSRAGGGGCVSAAVCRHGRWLAGIKEVRKGRGKGMRKRMRKGKIKTAFFSYF